MKNKILVVIGLIILVNLFFLWFLKTKNKTTIGKTASPVQEGEGIESEPMEPDQEESLVQDLPGASDQTAEGQNQAGFSITGNLVGDGQPWLVLYDDPQTGAVAATLELVLTDRSRCDFGQGDTSCVPMYFEVGTVVEAIGQKDGNKLIVSQIKKGVAVMPQ